MIKKRGNTGKPRGPYKGYFKFTPVRLRFPKSFSGGGWTEQ